MRREAVDPAVGVGAEGERVDRVVQVGTDEEAGALGDPRDSARARPPGRADQTRPERKKLVLKKTLAGVGYGPEELAPTEPACDEPLGGEAGGPAVPPASLGPMGLASFMRCCVQ